MRKCLHRWYIQNLSKIYTKFVTVHGLYLNRVFTLVMCLLTGKTVGQYRQVIQHLKQRVRHVIGHRWRSDMAICNFEQGLTLSIETELPDTMIKAYYFHFCQNLWWKIQKVGLARTYLQRRRLRKKPGYRTPSSGLGTPKLQPLDNR